MPKSIEERFIDYLSPSLPLFQKKSVAYQFQCPYCQTSGKNSKGKPYAPSDAKGYLYPYGNTWNYKCHKCGEHQSFVKFLEVQFPLLHFEYVRLRDQLGTTGFQTNCPALETVLKQHGVLSDHPSRFSSSPVKESQSINQVCSAIADSPNYARLPRLSPQQQAGCQSSLNHLIKERQKRRRERSGELW